MRRPAASLPSRHFASVFLVLCVAAFFGLEHAPRLPLIVGALHHRAIATPASFLISSEIRLGRFSNGRISLAEVLGAALFLNRTPVLPAFECCGSRNFDFYFQLGAAAAQNLDTFEFERSCQRSIIFVDLGLPKRDHLSEIRSRHNISTLTLHSFASDRPADLQAVALAEPYRSYFSTEHAARVRTYVKDLRLLEHLAERGEKCIVLGLNFMSVNWSRALSEFQRAQAQLVPQAYLLERVQRFLGDNSVAAAAAGGFVALHLRLTDFLALSKFHSLGLECTSNFDAFFARVRAVLVSLESPLLVVASDSYASKCVQNLRSAYPRTLLLPPPQSAHQVELCESALFDQEVLGRSAWFVGDKKSTFSLAIHHIRTLRNGRATNTTLWL